jgi:hypothetical protein
MGQARSWLSISGGGTAERMQQKIFSEQINIGDLPPPRRQKNFGQCTILGVKKIFPELLITNIAQFLCEYCTTTSI